MVFNMWKAWVVVAESSRAKIYGMRNLRTPLVELDDLVHPEGRLHARDLTSSRPGRAYDSVGQGRHAMEVDVGPKDQEAINFAKRITGQLESARTEGNFQKFDSGWLTSVSRFDAKALEPSHNEAGDYGS